MSPGSSLRRSLPAFFPSRCYICSLHPASLTPIFRQLVCETHRLLRPGGAHLVVSFRARRLLERLLAAPPLACSLAVHPIPAAGGPPPAAGGGAGRDGGTGEDGDGPGEGAGGAHVYLLRRGPGAPRAFDAAAAVAVRAHMDAAVKVPPPPYPACPPPPLPPSALSSPCPFSPLRSPLFSPLSSIHLLS